MKDTIIITSTITIIFNNKKVSASKVFTEIPLTNEAVSEILVDNLFKEFLNENKLNLSELSNDYTLSIRVNLDFLSTLKLIVTQKIDTLSHTEISRTLLLNFRDELEKMISNHHETLSYEFSV